MLLLYILMAKFSYSYVLLVGAGGALGSMARYGVHLLLSRIFSNPLPAGTLTVNLLGSFLIGLLFGLSQKASVPLSAGAMLFLATGFCGGFTTFSSFALENLQLVDKNFSALSLLYSGLTIFCGLLLCKVGIWVAS